VRGEEAEFAYHAGRVRLDASFTTIRAVQRREEAATIDTATGGPVVTVLRERTAAHTPAYTAGASLAVRLPFDAEVSGALRRSGERLMYLEQDDWMTGSVAWATKRLPPFTVGSVRVAKRVDRRTEVYAGVENVTDVGYAVRFGGRTDRDYPAPPRTWFAGASVAW
jgi:outer membrane receptor protein involved in Fe transport